MKVRKCAGCDRDFRPSRKGHVYHSEKCEDTSGASNRRDREDQQRVEATDGFVDRITGLNPPKTAIGYRLFCRELDLWLPLKGSKRWDGSKPPTDFFRLRPVELPLVPIETVYLLDWVLGGGGVHKVEEPITVPFARVMRAKEIEWRMRSFRSHPPVLPLLPYEVAALASVAALGVPAASLPALVADAGSPVADVPLLAPAPPVVTAAIPPLGLVEILEAIKQLGPEALAAFQAALVKTPITTP